MRLALDCHDIAGLHQPFEPPQRIIGLNRGLLMKQHGDACAQSSCGRIVLHGDMNFGSPTPWSRLKAHGAGMFDV